MDRESQPAKFDIPAIKVYGRKTASKNELSELAPTRLPRRQCEIEISTAILKARFLIFICKVTKFVRWQKQVKITKESIFTIP
jgi:hypothetical protein